jgi:hypothetical protein
MPSQAFDTGWDFGPVLGLIDSDLHVASPSRSPDTQTAAPIQLDQHEKVSLRGGGLHLGDFGKLFADLGLDPNQSPPSISPVDPDLGELSRPDDAELVPLSFTAEPTKTMDPDQDYSASGDDDIDGVDEAVEDVKSSTKKAALKKAKAEKRQARLASAFEMELAGKPVSKKQLKKLNAAGVREQLLARSKRPEVRNNTESRAESAPDTPNPRNGSGPAQHRYPLRSNIGAKVRPSTPVQVKQPSSPKIRPATPIQVEKSSSPKKRTASPNKKKTATPLPPLAQPFTPINSVPAVPQTALVPAAALTPGQIVNRPPIPFQPLTPQTQLSSAGYFTTPVTVPAGSYSGLVPRAVQSNIPQRPTQPTQQPTTPGRVPQRILIRSQFDRHVHFLGQLMHNFPEERKCLVSPMQLCNEKLAAEGIHVFVDASNIMIGFNDILRRSNITPYNLSFDSLALLMERRRPVAKRVSASSHREAAPLPHVTKLVDTSKAVGYENNVKEQVYIRREESEKKKFFKDVERVGWHKAQMMRSGNGSGSDSEMTPVVPATPAAPKWVEQGVDEILHLKMCQSIIDAEVPTTIVLATGDGAEAEHSDGFLAHVERALKKGWKVELLSWRKQLNGGYKSKTFRNKWSDKFKVIELDDYIESLMDTP